MTQSVGGEVKVITKHSLIYGLSNVLDRVIGFLMLPVYTRFLTPADYGVMELIFTTTNLLSMVIGIGIQSAVSRYYFEYSDDANRKKVVSTAFMGYGGVIILGVLILLPFSKFMATYILGKPEYTYYFIIALIAMALDMLIQIVYSYIRAQLKSLLMLILSISRTVLALSLNIYFIVFLHKGVTGILLSTLIANAAVTVFAIYYVLKNCGIKIDIKILGKMLNFGLPLIPSNISAYVVQASDRYFINSYADLTTTGLYSLGYKFGTLINQFVTSPFIQIWGPRRFEYFQKENSEKIYARIFTYFSALCLFVGLLISLLSKEAIQLVAAESFWPAHKIVPIITLSYIIFSFHFHFNVGIMMKNATKYIAYVNIITAVINLILNYFLIRYFSVWGAAVVTLICMILKVVLTWHFANRLHPIHMEWSRLSVLFITAFVLYFAGIFISSSSIVLNIITKLLIGLSYPFILYIIQFFDEGEMQKIKHIIATRKLSFD
jgi:O-antigen/teichoic acid export membrane protein